MPQRTRWRVTDGLGSAHVGTVHIHTTHTAIKAAHQPGPVGRWVQEQKDEPENARHQLDVENVYSLRAGGKVGAMEGGAGSWPWLPSSGLSLICGCGPLPAVPG